MRLYESTYHLDNLVILRLELDELATQCARLALASVELCKMAEWET